MTQALIQSADVDGFRVDTPMQAPFYHGLEKRSLFLSLSLSCLVRGLLRFLFFGFIRGLQRLVALTCTEALISQVPLPFYKRWARS